jgi:ABC-2 type transport system permease protein
MKNVLTFYRFLPSLFIILILCLTFTVLILYVANKIYLNILLKNSEENHSFSKKIKVKQRSISRALFFREFLTIFRSSNYSFQYLTIVVTTPLMVYFSNSIASNIGIEALGKGVLPGISVLVLIMFLTMGTSFAATSITREGGNFFHTKIIPVSYTKQVFVKFMLYVIVTIPSVMASCLVLALSGFLEYVEALLIAIAVILVIVGNIASSITLDIKRPQFMYLDGKEVTQTTKNVNQTLSQGFIIAAIAGIGGVLISMFVGVSSLYLVLFGFSVPYAAIEIFRLFFKLEDRYRRIEA